MIIHKRKHFPELLNTVLKGNKSLQKKGKVVIKGCMHVKMIEMSGLP